jgi:hypothetical protein
MSEARGRRLGSTPATAAWEKPWRGSSTDAPIDRGEGLKLRESRSAGRALRWLPNEPHGPSGILGRSVEAREVAVEVRRPDHSTFRPSSERGGVAARNPKNGAARASAGRDGARGDKASETSKRQRRNRPELGSRRVRFEPSIGIGSPTEGAAPDGRCARRKTLKGNETPREAAVHIGRGRSETDALDECRPAAGHALKGREPRGVAADRRSKSGGSGSLDVERRRDQYLRPRRTHEALDRRRELSSAPNPTSAALGSHRASPRARVAPLKGDRPPLATASFARFARGSALPPA